MAENLEHKNELLSATVRTLTERIEHLKNQRTNLAAHNASLGGQIDEVQAENETLRARIAELEKEKREAKDE